MIYDTVVHPERKPAPPMDEHRICAYTVERHRIVLIRKARAEKVKMHRVTSCCAPFVIEITTLSRLMTCLAKLTYEKQLDYEIMYLTNTAPIINHDMVKIQCQGKQNHEELDFSKSHQV